jgi:hypothetical protein
MIVCGIAGFDDTCAQNIKDVHIKDAALVGVLRALAEMDSKQPQAAWLDQTLPPEW